MTINVSVVMSAGVPVACRPSTYCSLTAWLVLGRHKGLVLDHAAHVGTKGEEKASEAVSPLGTCWPDSGKDIRGCKTHPRASLTSRENNNEGHVLMMCSKQTPENVAGITQGNV